MRSIDRLLLRFRSLFSRARVEHELDAELRFHLEQQIEENLAAGMSAEEARYAARRSIGGLTQIQEECRDARSVAWIETSITDLRYGWRMLRKSPVLTMVAILSLAIGIGANTTIFTIIDALMLKMLPVKNPSELVQFLHFFEGQRSNFSYPWYEHFRDQSHSFAGIVAVSNPNKLKLREKAETEVVECRYVSGNYFAVLGVNAFAGRVITPEDDTAKGSAAEPVAVLSYLFWKRRFGADPSVIGRTVFLEGVPFTIVGVTPPEFFGVETGRSPSIRIPMATERRIRRESWLPKPFQWLMLAARLKPESSIDQARADIAVIFQRLIAREASGIDDPHERRLHFEQRLDLISAGAGLDTLRIQFSEPLQILMAIVAVVLLIACANIANLLVGRAASRRREIAVRLALGAGRSRLLRQFLAESVLLSVIGGALGVLLASWGSNALVAFMSNGEPRILPVLTPDARVLLFTATVSLLTGVLFGLVPAFRATRVDAGPALKETRAMSASNKLGKILVISQAALSLVLLIGATLLARSLRNLETIDAGFDRANVLMLEVDAAGAGFKGAKLAKYYQQLLARIAEIPGVHSASGALITPIAGGAITNSVQVEGYTPQPEEDKEVYVNRVAPKYFETLATPLLAGRDFTLQDRKGAPDVAMINQTMARYYFQNANPIGRHITAEHSTMEIIGVVGDAKYTSLREKTPRTLYLPCFQDDLSWGPSVLVRTSLPLRAITGPLRSVARAVDMSVPVAGIKTLSEQVEQSLIRERMIAILASFFGLLALVLACIGLYGVMSYSVTRRTNEIGIRVALGAARRDVVWLVVKETMLLVAVGIGVGLPAALASMGVIRNLLFGLEPTDPSTILVATALMALVAGFAGYLPARRASRVDPMVALRYE